MPPFDDWLDRLAAPGPDPGGGAAGAVMLALGAALLEKVAGYPPRSGTGDLRPTGAAAALLRGRAQELVVADGAASARLVAALRAGTDDLAPAALAAAGTSADLVHLAADAEPLLTVLAERGSAALQADVAAAAAAYGAGVRIALVNLVGNVDLGTTHRADRDALERLRAGTGPGQALLDRLDSAAALRIPR